MSKRIFFVLLGMMLMGALPAFGQQDNGGGPGGPGGDGPPDFAQMRQRMEEELKQKLGATDEEWSALQGKIEAVIKLQHELHPRPGFGPGGPGSPGGPGGPDANGGPDGNGGQDGGQGNNMDQGGPGGPGGPDAPKDDSPVRKAVDELNKVLADKDAKPEQIKAAAAKVRDERAKVKAELIKAQADLQSLLSARQEAVLLAMGILE